MRVVFLAAALATVTAMSSADSLPFSPGMWETTVTSTNSLTGTTTHSSTSCTTEGEFDLRSIAQGAQGCELVDSNIDENTLTYSMACNVQGAESTVQGTYTVDGDGGEGTMNMTMTFDGQTMTVENVFTSKRIGDC